MVDVSWTTYKETLTISWYLVRSDPTQQSTTNIEFWNVVRYIPNNCVGNPEVSRVADQCAGKWYVCLKTQRFESYHQRALRYSQVMD